MDRQLLWCRQHVQLQLHVCRRSLRPSRRTDNRLTTWPANRCFRHCPCNRPTCNEPRETAWTSYRTARRYLRRTFDDFRDNGKEGWKEDVPSQNEETASISFAMSNLRRYPSRHFIASNITCLNADNNCVIYYARIAITELNIQFSLFIVFSSSWIRYILLSHASYSSV